MKLPMKTIVFRAQRILHQWYPCDSEVVQVNRPLYNYHEDHSTGTPNVFHPL